MDDNATFSETGKFFSEIEQRSVIIGQIININDFSNPPRKIKLAVDDISIDTQHSFETEIDDDGNFLFDIPLYHSINSYLLYGNSRLTPFLFANDTLSLKCQIDKRNGSFGIVSGKFNEEFDKFQNEFRNQYYWIHYEQINNFNNRLSEELSPKELKRQYFEFEKELQEKIRHRVKTDSLNSLLADYLRYSATYSIYDKIIDIGKRIENEEEKQTFYSFLTDTIVFNKEALITSDFNSFHNSFKFNVETGSPVFLEPKERTKEEFRQEITTKELIRNLKMRDGVWSEFLAASDMFFTGFLEEEINQSVINSYSVLIEENFKDPYIKQLLLSKCDETRKKVAKIRKQKIPVGAQLNYEASLSGKDIMKKMLDDNAGKIIYIDFWATWCSPCKRQIPHSLKLQELYTDVEFVYVCCQSEKDTWKNVIKQYQINGSHILITKEQFEFFENKFSITGVPHYVLIDKKGEIYFNDYPGCKTEQVIEEKLKNLTTNKRMATKL